MSVILCRKEQVSRPYYIETLGVHIYTSQELCYAVYHHPLLAMDGFVNANLVDFVRDQLKMGMAALKMERWLKSGENPDELIFLLLQESNYYTTVEINKLRQKISILRKLPKPEYEKRRADYLFRFKQYGKAMEGYEKLLEEGSQFKIDDQFAGRIWNNLGICYARVFRFENAMEAFEHAYGKLKDEAILEKMYHLTMLDPGLKLKERYETMVTEDKRELWNEHYEQAKAAAETSEEVEKLGSLFSKDPIRRMEGAAGLVEGWKREYRGMA